MMTQHDFDKSALALVIWREAAGEPIEGKVAVGNVIKNRVEAMHLPDQWDDVIFLRWAFSSMTAFWVLSDQVKKFNLPDDFVKKFKNYVIADPMTVKWPRSNDQSWIDSMQAADRVMDLQGTDNTDSATFYCNLDVCHPDWADKFPVTVKIGHHTFFKG
jgi:spore germination cell wall hydrolase CwlJ-like protein